LSNAVGETGGGIDGQNGRLVFSEEVEHALQSNDPVIALESTIITHGTLITIVNIQDVS